MLGIGKGRERGMPPISHKGTICSGRPATANIALKRDGARWGGRFLSKDRTARQLSAGLWILLFKAQ